MKTQRLYYVLFTSLVFCAPLHATENKFSTSTTIEFETTYIESYAKDKTNSINLASVETNINLKVNKKIDVELGLLYEDDTLKLDAATIHFQADQTPWSLTLSQSVIPFARFDSNMVSDPLSLNLAETRETFLQAHFNPGLFASSMYIFNGSNHQNNGRDNKIDNYGFNLDYKTQGRVNFSTRLSYLNDIGDSNTIQESINANLGNNETIKHIAASAISAVLDFSDFKIIAEHIMAHDRFAATELAFNNQGAKPSVTNVEIAYSFTLANSPATFAVAQQTTNEAPAISLAKSSLSTALSIHIENNTHLTFELLQQNDYSVEHGATGQTEKSFTTKLAVKF